MAGEVGLALALFGLTLGLRHGIDWDHIAAITDITQAQPSRWRGFLMGTLYALGHASVVVMLGLLAILAGRRLPDWVDGYMERVVGVTLVVLGVWVLYSLVRDPGAFRLQSRWMLVFAAVRRAYRWLVARLAGRATLSSEPAASATYGVLASIAIGMIHGIGAETGSQALVLAAAAGATSAFAASYVLIWFVLGLVISNSFITLGSILGILGASTRKALSLALGVLVGVFSLGVGLLFLLGLARVLPGFFA